MINPWRVHRAKAIVISIENNNADVNKFKVKLVKSGQIMESWRYTRGIDLCKNIKLGDVVNIQASFSITADKYLIETVNKPRVRK